MLIAILVLVSFQTLCILSITGSTANIVKELRNLRIFGNVPQEPPYGRN